MLTKILAGQRRVMQTPARESTPTAPSALRVRVGAGGPGVRACTSAGRRRAGFGSAVLAWLSLTTTVQPLSPSAVLALTLAVVVVAALVSLRGRGPRRWLALSGALIAVLPLLVIAVFLSLSDG